MSKPVCLVGKTEKYIYAEETRAYIESPWKWLDKILGLSLRTSEKMMQNTENRHDSFAVLNMSLVLVMVVT